MKIIDNNINTLLYFNNIKRIEGYDDNSERIEFHFVKLKILLVLTRIITFFFYSEGGHTALSCYYYIAKNIIII